ncbi:PC4-domain-containing protein [Artomyces pyxidatus]|uniref:PC4-domain-containing protein n=1 Tax=Artomyces pyxidatus TaxID=48021 RepID=A0ACB8T4E6_9AGAM|nr:PC4-domain-containing protein [Artomyces pyxidatus]
MAKRKAALYDEHDDSHDEDSVPLAGSSKKAPAQLAKRSKVKKDAGDAKTTKAKAKDSNEESSGGAPMIRVNHDGDKYLDLGKKKRVTVRTFKGMPLIDIREYWGDEGDEKPGKKGISLSPEQWKVLVECAEDISNLLPKAK